MGFLDIRIEKTERAIKQAFMELRREKPVEKIRVKELCDRACINKSTFYAHFQDIYALANAMEDEMVHAVVESLPRLTASDVSERTEWLAREMFRAFMTYQKEMAEQFGIENDVRVSTLSHYPDVFVMEEQSPDEQKLWAGLEQALRQAAAQFVESRIAEGERLRTDLVEKLDGMISYVDYIEERSPQILDEYRMRLESKVQELLGDRQLDDARIAAEITIFADKICVDEETVRLRSHILSMKETLLAGGGMGRKLDFIAQEMNREANTILSKTTDLKVSDVGINLKTDIEKVREQIQNIE